MLEFMGENENKYNHKVIEDLYSQIKDSYDGFLYSGYPIYSDRFFEEPIKIDGILISNRGLLIIHVSESQLIDFTEIQDTLYTKIELRLKSHRFLVKDRKLLCNLDVVSVSPNGSKSEKIVTNVDELVGFCRSNLSEDFNSDLLIKLNSAIQEAYGLGKRNNIDSLPGTKSELIQNMNLIVETHDTKQMQAILKDPVGIQRIRGMAGSGKTIVLARKAVELHTAHPEWKILVTYNTRSVKPMLMGHIDRIYRMKNEGQKPNYNNLIIMHGWGSSSSPGFYYYMCKHHDVSPYTLTEAKGQFGSNEAFSGICAKLLKDVKDFKKLFDCILIDEAQDFPIPFFRLCLKSLDKNKRLVYAYDELQKLNEEAMPVPNKIFGCEIAIDTPLKVSYRNQSSVIVAAHAFGMGIYRDIDHQNSKLVQIPDSNDIWEVIGYESQDEIRGEQEVTLYRTKETSPDFLKTDKKSLINLYSFSNNSDQINALVELLEKDFNDEKVPMKDIMIIDMETFTYKENYNFLKRVILKGVDDSQLNVHLAGTLHPEDFARLDSIVYSTILRAKGNESYVVYIINSQECMSSLKSITNRNQLFTAITRSKGWVNILGYGDAMESLKNEFEEIEKSDYKLHFQSYPTEQEKAQIRTTNVDLRKDDVIAIDHMEKLLASLPKEQFDEVMKKFTELKKED